MGKAEQRAKDAAMAARLKNDPVHKGSAVAARKAAHFAEFMRKLAGKN